MKFASLLIDMNFIGQAKAQRAQRKDTFHLPLRGPVKSYGIKNRQKKNIQSLRDIFGF